MSFLTWTQGTDHLWRGYRTDVLHSDGTPDWVVFIDSWHRVNLWRNHAWRNEPIPDEIRAQGFKAMQDYAELIVRMEDIQ